MKTLQLPNQKILRTADMGYRGTSLAVLRYQSPLFRGHLETFQTVSKLDFSHLRAKGIDTLLAPISQKH
jgi:hypothetical protein